MRAAVKYLVVAVALGLVAAVLLMSGLVQRQMADAERSLATLGLNRAARLFDEVQDRLRFSEGVTWLLRETRDEVEARRAEVRYWRGEYATLVAEYPDIGRPEIRDNLSLQLTLASAYLRSGEASALDDRDLMLGQLDRAISVYLQVLQNTRGNRDAAYNYEYLIRLRDEIAAGAPILRRPPRTPLGRPGDMEEMDMEEIDEIQIYVPSDMLERESTDEPTLGTDPRLRRRG